MTQNTFDPTKPVQTRDGRKARILCVDIESQSYPIVAAIKGVRSETVESFTSEGRSWLESESDDDLINIPPQVVKTYYKNIYDTDIGSHQFDSITQAGNFGINHLKIGVIKVTVYSDNTFTVEKCDV